jgi:septal ring factor EnvC (AmiA/AmiB activator)
VKKLKFNQKFINTLSLPVLNSHFKIGAIAFLIFFSSFTYGQKKTDLDKRKTQLEAQVAQLKKDIALMEGAINKTASQKKLTQKEIDKIKEDIAKKNKQITSFKNEIASFDKDIKNTSTEINSRVSEVELLKKQYGNLLKQIYSSIISEQHSSSFLLTDNKNFIHKNYLKTISSYRIIQANEIKNKIENLEGKRAKLELSKDEIEKRMREEDLLKRKLDQEKKNKDKQISELSEKEKTLKKQIEAKNRAAARLNDNIRKIIEEQIRLAQERAKQNKPKPDVTSPTVEKPSTYLTPKELELSKDFSSNQGRLPWPIIKGNIASSFGRQEHPTLKGVYIENNGIDFRTEPGASVRSIFSGNVVSVFYLPTTHHCIIVKHGEYFSVYSNVINPTVKAGDIVSAKQSIGKVYTDETDNSTKVHLEIWKGKEKINPAYWVVR